jgi:hypothetical protein
MEQYEPQAGDNIASACKTLCQMAKASGQRVSMKFNDLEVIAFRDSDPAKLAEWYYAVCEQRHAAYLASPEGQAAERRAEQARKRAAESEAEGILSFSVKDQATWDKQVEQNTDSYGACVIRYAARWANLMEKRLKTGAGLKDIADKEGHRANTEGITGFMYGCAVQILAAVWEHGEELRVWHNLKTQVGIEGERANASGGVLNPAILNIG